MIKLKFLLFAMCFLVLIIAWVIGVFISKLITEPIRILHEGTERVGKGDLNYKIEIGAKDEIGQLSKAFNKMTDNLRMSTTSIDNLNKEIAERKQADENLKIRTEELEKINKAFIGRELKMKELKKEIEEFKKNK